MRNIVSFIDGRLRRRRWIDLSTSSLNLLHHSVGNRSLIRGDVVASHRLRGEIMEVEPSLRA